MIAAFEVVAGVAPCVVRRIARSGLKIVAQSYCGQHANAADGVLQLPDTAKVCGACSAELKKA